MISQTVILYLTSKCNLSCDYCYEKEKRESDSFENFSLSYEEIDSFFNKLDPLNKICIVLFGGEPLLELDKIKYIFTKYIDSRFSYNITTNGLILKHKLNEFIEICQNYKNITGKTITLEISNDVSTQWRRVYKNGSDTTQDINLIFNNINSLYKISQLPFKFYWRYTINKDNYNNMTKDFIYIFENYDMVERIILSWVHDEIEDSFKKIEEFIPYVKGLYKIYNKRICFNSYCEICNECTYQNSQLKYFNHKKNKVFNDEQRKIGKFNNW